jgi:pilus assembly protein CpaC
MKIVNALAKYALVGIAATVHSGLSCALSLDVNKAVLVTLRSPASTIFVAEPSVATYQLISPRKVLIMGKSLGETTFMVLNDAGNSIYTTQVSVGYDLSRMKRAIRDLYPSLSIKLTATADSVIVSGIVPTPQMAADIIAIVDSYVKAGQSSATSISNSSDTTGAATGTGTMGARIGRVINRLTVTLPTQVIIRVRFAEVSRDVSEKLGVNWFWGRVHNGHHPFAVGFANNAMTNTVPHAGTSGWLFNELGGIGVPDFSAMIDVLASDSLISILAEPNLSVVSGESASFLAGGEIPVKNENTQGQATTEWKEYGVKLDVSPTILSENRMSLRIRPEVSHLGPSVDETPSIITRKAETTIELADGQSFVIGGLLQNNISNDVSKIPGLGDLPVMGALFRSKGFERNETELVIIATAYISNPNKGQLRIPNANVVIPNMFERLFLGKDPQPKAGVLRAEDMIF